MLGVWGCAGTRLTDAPAGKGGHCARRIIATRDSQRHNAVITNAHAAHFAPRTNRAHGAPLQQAATTAATPAASSHDASGASNSERSLRSRVGWWKKETRWQLLAASSSAGTGPRMVDDAASAQRMQ